MKILIVYRHYWPDTPPLGSILRELAEHLARRGHKVTVLTAQPSYRGRRQEARPRREAVGGVEIVRMALPRDPGRGPLRLVAAAVFLLKVFAYAARHRFDLVWTTSLPPVLNGVVGRLAARVSGGRFLYHVLDVYPEAAVAGGLMRQGRAARLAARIDSATCRAADAVVVLSEDMVATIAGRGGGGAIPFHVINNPVLPQLEIGGEPGETAGERPFRFVFAGNLGRFQALDTVLAAAARLPADRALELVFLGDGPARAGLQRQAAERGLDHVRFLDPLPAEEARAYLSGCHAGIVSLAPGIYRTSYPSKVMTYLAAGLPILAVVESESALAGYLARNEAGTATGHDPSDVAAAMTRMVDRFGTRAPHARLSELARTDFGPDRIATRWASLVEGLGAE